MRDQAYWNENCDGDPSYCLGCARWGGEGICIPDEDLPELKTSFSVNKRDEMGLSELWKSPEWKKAASAFIDGKPCAWCGTEPGDTYETKKGSIRKLGFAPHHVEKHKWGLPLYNEVKNRLFAVHWKKKTASLLFMPPIGLSRKEYREQVEHEWEKENLGLIRLEFDAKRSRIFDEYKDLNDDRIVVLCTRCHYAREHGLVLCKTCGKGYHKPKYDQCWKCIQTQKQGEVKDRET